MIKLAPSVLAADFTCLGEEIKKVYENGAEYLHLDVMDGMFVPNISLGPGMIASMRKVCDIVFDVHLMSQDPIRYIDDFAKAGADIIVFHYEATNNHKEVIDAIHSFGKKAGMSIKPGTPTFVLEPFMNDLDLVHLHGNLGTVIKFYFRHDNPPKSIAFFSYIVYNKSEH